MRHLLGTALLILAGANQGWAVSPVDAKAQGGDPAAAAKAASGDAKGSSPDSTEERWRFKRHQGLWWYWLPTNKWVYWTGDRWVGYDAKTYAEFSASRNPQPTYSYPGASYSGGSQSSVWGQERFNQYGQPQYPYSQRSSGIRQLGPVPAMGGVRSLPGWGGER